VVKIAKLKLSEHLQIGKQEKPMPAFYKIDKPRRALIVPSGVALQACSERFEEPKVKWRLAFFEALKRR